MNGVGDSNSTFDNDFKNMDEPSERTYTTDQELKVIKKPYKRNLLTNAQKSFVFLEQQSLVDFIEADGEYIVSAGRDHDINVWDGIEGRHIRRLSGHTAPITGLYLYTSEELPSKRIVISASEDGSIRKWLLNKGEELGKIDTDNVITCMGILNKTLAVIGNHKGYVEVRHLDTGELYSSMLAHEDPVDALAVRGKYACSATFDIPSCLKVWEIQFEGMTCIYQIDKSLDVEYSSLAMWNTTLILGAADEVLHIINFKTDENRTVELGAKGEVTHVGVWNEWILSCSVYKKESVLDVHRIHNYEHFGTFNCNMQLVFATAAMESDSSFKIVLGGSALAILSFDFILTQDTKMSLERPFESEKSRFIQNKSPYTLKSTVADEDYGGKSSESESDTKNKNIPKSSFIQNKSLYTLKTRDADEDYGGKSSESESDTNNENIPDNPYKNIFYQQTSDENVSKILQKEEETEINMIKEKCEATEILLRDSQLPNLRENILNTPIIPPDMKYKLLMRDKTILEKIFLNQEEPRVILRNLELLDENNSDNLLTFLKNDEKFEMLKKAKDTTNEECERNKHEKIVDQINEVTKEILMGKEKDKAKANLPNTNDISKTSSNSLNVDTNDLNNEQERNEKSKENSSKYVKFSTKKEDKGKTNKKKSAGKAKHKRCLIT